jgi:ABC-type bacteriocin/lantibiotic exporter with double-glycine peptidase domain
MVKIPYFKQETEYTCGPAAMRMILAALGIKKTEKELAKLMRTSKLYGTPNRRLPKLVERLKLDHATVRNGNIEELKKFLKEGYLIIVGYYSKLEGVGHFAVVKKIGQNYIYLLDPKMGPDLKYSHNYFMKIWHNDPVGTDREDHWFFAVRNA